MYFFFCNFAGFLSRKLTKEKPFNYLGMKKIFTLLVMIIAMCMQPSMLRADELGPLYDGTNQYGSYIPVDGNNIDRFQRVQVLYPKADISALSGKSITKMTFYVATKAAKAWNTRKSIVSPSSSIPKPLQVPGIPQFCSTVLFRGWRK